MVKYCQKKVDEMTRMNRTVAKFMKIYKNTDKSIKIDNFVDQQMKKIVDEFRAKRKKNKKVKTKKTVKGLNNNIHPNNKINNNMNIVIPQK